MPLYPWSIRSFFNKKNSTGSLASTPPASPPTSPNNSFAEEIKEIEICEKFSEKSLKEIKADLLDFDKFCEQKEWFINAYLNPEVHAGLFFSYHFHILSANTFEPGLANVLVSHLYTVSKSAEFSESDRNFASEGLKKLAVLSEWDVLYGQRVFSKEAEKLLDRYRPSPEFVVRDSTLIKNEKPKLDKSL